MVKILLLLLWLNAKCGAKNTLADFTGRAIVNRWWIVHRERHEDTAVLPNIVVHQNLTPDTPDGPDSHRHGRSSCSWIVAGGYWEEVDGVLRYNARWSFARVRYDQFHRIVKVDPGTWTIFMLGWRRLPFAFHQKPCVTVCETCAATTGVCQAAALDIPYSAHFGDKGARKRVFWTDDSAPAQRRLRIRRRAIKKFQLPSSDELAAAYVQDQHARERHAAH